METPTIYIAIVDTRYEVAGAATTEDEAVRIASQRALEHLKDLGVTEHRTWQDVADYFGVKAFPVKVGEADVIRW